MAALSRSRYADGGLERGNVIGIVSAKLNASAALAASGALPENVNYAVKSSLLLSLVHSSSKCDNSEEAAFQTFLFRRKPLLPMA